MSDAQAKELRFRLLLSWGGVVIALIGLILLLTGSRSQGLLLLVAGVVAFLFAKRRTRRSGG